MPKDQPWSEQTINTLATLAIATQVKGAADVEAKLKTDFNKLRRGQLDAIAIKILGFPMDYNLIAEEFYLQIGEVTVKPLRAMRGDIRLVHPSQGSLSLTLHKDAFTAALNSRELSIWDGNALAEFCPRQTASESTWPLSCRFDRDVATFTGRIMSSGMMQKVTFAATPEVISQGRGIGWQNVSYLEGEAPPQFIERLLARASELLNLQAFEQRGTSFFVEQIALTEAKLILQARAEIEQFPDA